MLDIADAVAGIPESKDGEIESTNRQLLFCYVSGLDLRRVDERNCPFMTSAFADYPWVSLRNLPSNELFPTLVTGVSPVTHGVWGVRLRPPEAPSPAMRVWCGLPDFVTTSVQGFLHFGSAIYDLAAIPPRRRRRFEITRTKYKRRNRRSEAMFRIGGIPTVFDVVGEENSRYVFDSSLDSASKVMGEVCQGSHVIEALELYSLDRYQQWNLDRPEQVRAYYGRIDAFMRRLHQTCVATGRLLMLVSDHGHEPIRDSIDLAAMLRQLDLPDDSYDCFIEVSNVRFWFHDDKARHAVTAMLSGLENGTALTHDEMAKVGLPLKDGSYGELFCYLDPGYIFFPHDFHHPLANLWLGLADPLQRSRLRDPRHKGNHGHLPHFDAERSFLTLLDDSYEAVAEAGDILDVAPSILGALGRDRPSSMRGKPLFRRKSAG